MQASSTRNRNSGFTLVELILVMVIASILLVVIFGTLSDFLTDNLKTAANSTQDTDTRSVLRSIENDASIASSFSRDLTVSGAPLGSSNNAAAWSYAGNDATMPNNRVLIVGVYATDKSPTDNTRMPIFTDMGTGCSPSTAAVVQNAYVYFAAQDPNPNAMSSIDHSKHQYNLYRRTIVNTTGGTLCQTPYQKQTCASNLVSTYPSVCTAGDAVLLRDIGTFTVDYYTSANDSSPLATEYTTASALDIASAKSVKLTVTTNRMNNGSPVQNTASIRISLQY